MDKKIVKYNPAFLTADELVEGFVVRHAELGLVVEVVRENVTESNQHFLVIGPRGIGKTMLVLRAAEEIRRDEELSEKWYPLVFSEESYPVTTPGEFWLEALFHLSHQSKDKRWRQTYKELNSEQDEVRLRERALAQLMDFADAAGKRILLIVENFNMLVGEQISDDDAWALRHTLLNERRVMLLATATNRFEQIENSGKAMFELFRTLKLKPLDREECGILWRSITGEEVTSERIRPIQILTGGSPRLMRIISSFASRMSFRELMEDLMRLVDEHTEYFKSHLESLPATERKVYLALAELWDPVTAREVAKAGRIGVNKASALLRRLMERGAVEANGRGRRKLYQVSERMYNIYYLMRRRGAPSRRVKAVVNFMVSFYGREKLIRIAGRIAEEACSIEAAYRKDHFYAIEALLQDRYTEKFRGEIINAVPGGFYKMPDAPDSIKQLAESEKDKELTKLLKQGEELEEAGKVEEAESVYRNAIELASKDARPWGYLGQLLHEHLGRYEEAEEAYRKAVELDAEYAWGWGQLGQLLHEHLGRYEEAEAAYRRAIELESKTPFGWGMLGQLLEEHLGRYEDAEEAYRKALELQPDTAFGWGMLGQLLDEHLGRYEEAEEAYRKALELQPDMAFGWSMLGVLLHEHLCRYEEAEEAYRRVIELEPKKSFGWVLLGVLLQYDLKRYEEAEQAYRKVIELEPEDYLGWLSVGHLLHLNSERYEEAEQAYRKAIELDEPNPLAWSGLILLLQEKMGRSEEALGLLREYVEKAEMVKGAIDNTIDLFVDLAAGGYGGEALEILRDSASAEILEPLVVGLRMFVGEGVKAAAEIMEVGKDVVKRIEKRRESQIKKAGNELGKNTKDKQASQEGK